MGIEFIKSPYFFGVGVNMKKTLIGFVLLTVLATTLGACGGGEAPAGGGASPAASPAASPSPKKS